MSAEARIATRGEAQALIDSLVELMRAIGAALDEESALARGGRLKPLAAAQARKSELASRWIAELRALNTAREALLSFAPERVEALRAAHAALQGKIGYNMAVLATARAVSESLVEEIAQAVARQERPETYGAQGALAPRDAPSSRPVVLRRSI